MMELPIIDISRSDSDAAQSLVQALATHGFVYVKNVNQGVAGQSLQSMFQLALDFFKSPVENKAPCAVNSKSSGKNSGWFGMHMEKLDPTKQERGDFKEAFNMNEFKNGKAQQPLPEPLKTNEDMLNAFADACHELCLRILQLIAVGLGIDSAEGGQDWFSARHDRSQGDSGSVFRLLYYPRVDQQDSLDYSKDIRAGAHSDYGTITLLFQREGQPGLEILSDDTNARWTPVAVNPEDAAEIPILVNIGDLLSYWTNGLLKSTVHRVVFPQGSSNDRYSIAYFCHPLNDARLEPIPSEMVHKHAQNAESHFRIGKGSSMTAKEHLESRLMATYGT